MGECRARGTVLGSLRFRLTAWYTGVLALILVLAAVLVFLVARHSLRAETDGYLASEARHILGVAAGQPGAPSDPDDITAALTPAGPAPARDTAGLLLFDVFYARVLVPGSRHDPMTSPALASRPDLRPPLDALLSRPPPPRGRYDVVGAGEARSLRVLTVPIPTVPTPLGPRPGVLQVAVPWGHSAGVLHRLCLLLALGVALALPAVALGGWVLIGRTLQPIGRIVAEAERLDATALPDALLPPAAETDSEVGRLVATLNRMTTRIRRAFDAQRRFAADASHELRTPLTILRGEMELALARPRPPEVYRATLASAVEEVARMSRIVEGLSALARRDAGQRASGGAWVPVDLAALGRVAVAEFTPMARLKQITLQGDLPGEQAEVWVRGDPDQLLSLVRNLVDNAVRYTPPGGRVTVTAGADGGAATLAVEDTGIGIAPEDLPHVFERFWRADRSRANSGGSGLGLSLCAETAAAHGGRVAATSEPGRGSRFLVVLPAYDREGAAGGAGRSGMV